MTAAYADEPSLVESLPYRLRDLSDALLRLGTRLDINEADGSSWEEVVCSLYLMRWLNGRHLIAVAGGQGAGKTHLLRNLYPAAEKWLKGDVGRGEKNAVIVEEWQHCSEPYGVVAVRRKGGEADDGDPSPVREVVYEAGQWDAWYKAVSGDDGNVVYARLVVPAGFLGVDGWGFLLLPGLERDPDSRWQRLTRLVMATSPAALVVVDGSAGLADATQHQVLEELRADDGTQLRYAVAISRCEDMQKQPEKVREWVARAAEVFKVDETDVLPVGRTVEDPENWPVALRELIGRVHAGAAQSRRLEARILRDLVKDDVVKMLSLARYILDGMSVTSSTETDIEPYIKLFDAHCDNLRETLEIEVTTAYKAHYKDALKKLNQRLDNAGIAERGKRFVDWTTMKPDRWATRLEEEVKEVWSPEAAQKIQQETVRAIVDAWIGDSGTKLTSRLAQRRALEQTAAFLSGKKPDKTGEENTGEENTDISAIMQALPGAALVARSAMLRLAQPDGTIVVPQDQKKLHEIFEDFAGDYRQVFGVLYGFVASGTSDMPENTVEMLVEIRESGEKFIKNVIAPLAGAGAGATAGATALSSGAAAAPTATAVVGTASTATVATVGGTAGAVVGGGTAAAGAEVAGAGAATVASATVVASLSALAVGAAVALGIHAGNKATRERNRLSRELLNNWRIASETSVLGNYDETMRLLRIYLVNHLSRTLGADDLRNQRYALQAAIADVRRARADLLEALRDDHLA